jgi:hypothetical protein
MNKTGVLPCHICREGLRKTMNKTEVLPCHNVEGLKKTMNK